MGQEIVFYEILERKNAFLGHKNNKFKKLKNWHFSKGVNPWFWFKNGHFSNFSFLGNIGHKNVFHNILERKSAFLGYKNKKCKQSKNWHGPKMAIFPTFFRINLVQDKVFYDILERKNALLGCIKKKFKQSKNWHFSKGVNPLFWSKNGHFSNFFF